MAVVQEQSRSLDKNVFHGSLNQNFWLSTSEEPVRAANFVGFSREKDDQVAEI